jgi:hypothetical protein
VPNEGPCLMQILDTVIGNGRRAAFGSSKSTGYALELREELPALP